MTAIPVKMGRPSVRPWLVCPSCNRPFQRKVSGVSLLCPECRKGRRGKRTVRDFIPGALPMPDKPEHTESPGWVYGRLFCAKCAHEIAWEMRKRKEWT